MNHQTNTAFINADRSLVGILSRDIQKFRNRQRQSNFEELLYSSGNRDCTRLNIKPIDDEAPLVNIYRKHVEG